MAGRQDQRPGNIPLCFLLAFPVGRISRNVLVILFQQRLVLFGLDSFFDKALPEGPAKLGCVGGNLFLYTAALILHCSFSRHNQSLNLSPSRLIHLLHLIRAHLLLLSGSGVPCPGPNSCPKRRLGNTLDELKLPPCSVALVLDSDGLP